MTPLLGHKQVIIGKYCQYPVIFYLQGGTVLSSIGLHGIKPFTTKYYLITSTDHSSGCLNLRLLKPSKHCSNKMILVPSDTCITVDRNCICGFQFLPCIPVGECEQSPIIIEDCMCAPFSIVSGYKETVLWKTNFHSSFSGSLSLCIEEGFHESLELRVYHHNLHEYCTYPITQEDEFFILQDCKMITLHRKVPLKKVKGIFEIKMAGELIDEDEVVPSFLQ